MAKPKADFRVAQSLFANMITSAAKNCEYHSVELCGLKMYSYRDIPCMPTGYRREFSVDGKA